MMSVAPNVRLHDLRHFTATQLIGAGVDVLTIAGRLGHSDPSLGPRVYNLAIEERDIRRYQHPKRVQSSRAPC